MTEEQGVAASPPGHPDEPASSLAANAGSVPNAEWMRRVLEVIADFPVKEDATAITAKMLQQVAARGLGRQTVSQEALDLVQREWIDSGECNRPQGPTRLLSDFLRDLRGKRENNDGMATD